MIRRSEISRAAVAAALSAASIVACGGAGPATDLPPASADAPETRRTPPAPTKASPGSSAFAAVANRIVDEWLRREPVRARALGLHDFDGRLADYSAAGIASFIEWLQKTKIELAAIDRAALGPDDLLDLAIVTNATDIELFQHVDLQVFKRRPQHYEELFAVNIYLDREYAPLEERGRRLLAHEEAALGQVGNVRANLVSPMSKPVVQTAVKIYRGYAEYLRGDVVRLLKGVGDAAFQARFAKTNEALAKAAADLAEYLEKTEVPKGDNSHVLGPELYKKLLAVQEGLPLPLGEFKKMGEENLAVNKLAFEALRKSAKVTRPKASELLASATQLMESSRRFIQEKKLVTIPTEDTAMLKETPPYMRWNAAFLDAPGAFEKAKNAFYYITMPDPTWSKKEQEGYVMTQGILLATTVHEVYPGHYLQGQWLRRAPTRVEKVFESYSFVEGWAHYGEQLMIEQGFGAEDPQNRLGQLSDALLRNCRFVVSLGVHAEKMTLETAEKRFMTDCFQDKATAREQAVRATFDPGYFAYTLGKIQILALREEAKQRLGAKFDLQRFHDALLAHGSPPVPLIRERVLRDLGGADR
jgi:uncharacterized protein (DUF885 family)